MNVPFSTVNYTSQLIEDQQGRTAADTLINDASVRASTGSNGFDDTLQIRGFPVPAQRHRFERSVRACVLQSCTLPDHRADRTAARGPVRSSTALRLAAASAAASTSSPSVRGEMPFTRLTPFFMSAGNYGLHLDDRQPLRREQGVGRSVQRGRAQRRSLDPTTATGGPALARWRSTIAAIACAGRSMPSPRTMTPGTSVRRSAFRPTNLLPAPARRAQQLVSRHDS